MFPGDIGLTSMGIHMTTIRRALGILGGALVGTVMAAAPAAALDIDDIGKFGDWSAHSYDLGGSKVCYLVGEPIERKVEMAGRERAFILISNRPGSDVFGEISVIAGYPFQESSRPQASVGGQTFPFFTDGDTAWVFEEQEEALLTAMKRGVDMEISSTSQGGVQTRDVYSLTGVTAGTRAIDDACKP